MLSAFSYAMKTSQGSLLLLKLKTKTNGIRNSDETTLDENLLKTPGNNSAAFKELVNIY